MHRDHVGVGITARPEITELLMVQAVEKIFDHAHGGGRILEVDAAAEAGPVGGLGVLDGVAAAICQQREQDREGGPDVLGAMATIVSGVFSGLYVRWQQRIYGYIRRGQWHPGVLRVRDPRLGVAS